MTLAGLSRKDKIQLLVGFCFACLILFVNLGSEGMYAPQEGRTAIIVRNMLLSGNYLDMIVPHGIPYEKPIGHYWLCLPFGWLFALWRDPMTVAAEWALRLPSAICGVSTCIGAALLAMKIYNIRTAAVTMIVLSSMATFATLGWRAHIDMPLACAFCWAMYFLYVGVLETGKSNSYLYGFYALAGWGVLLKGPVVVILAGLVVAVELVRRRDWRFLAELRILTGIPVFLAVALPWYWIESVRTNGAFFEEFILRQNLGRFIGQAGYRDNEFMPLWYYFPKLFAGTAPWSVIAIAAMVCCWKRLLLFRFRAATGFLLSWALTGFVFFSFSALKRGDYLLPIYPALAILTAAAIDRYVDVLPGLFRRWRLMGIGLVVMLIGALLLNLAGVFHYVGNEVAEENWHFMSKRDGMNLMMYSDFFNQYVWITLLGIFLLSGIIWLLGTWAEKRQYERVFQVFVIVVLCAFTIYHGVIQPGTDQFNTVKPFIREVRTLVPDGELIVYFHDFNTELIFFLDHPYEIDLEKAEQWVITDEEGLTRLRELAPGEWEELCRTIEHHHYPAILLKRMPAVL